MRKKIISIIGAGAVGASCAQSILLTSVCNEIILHDINEPLALGLATDLSHGAVLHPPCLVRSGTYKDMKGSEVIIITAGINEKSGAAIDRGDQLGRLRLFPPNAKIYQEIVPQIAKNAPDAIILVVTDPPDPLADVARKLTKTNPIISAGTYLDSLRFRLQIGQLLNIESHLIEANVIGEHGTSQVYVWSSAMYNGQPVLEIVRSRKNGETQFKKTVERNVKYANISIIEGTGASQRGIGIVTAKIVKAISQNEGLEAPVGTYNDTYKVTLSLPSIIDRSGVSKVIVPDLNGEEQNQLYKSAEQLQKALKMI